MPGLLPHPWPILTPGLLNELCIAAQRNASELLYEAELLLTNRRWARAYFLAVAAIEETDKAMMAHDSMNRNLTDPAIVKRLRTHSESHQTKVAYALMSLIPHSKDQRRALDVVIDLIGAVQRGREPSMYAELLTNPDRAEQPSQIASQIAATDCVRLARDCFDSAAPHLRARPPAITADDDRMLALKSSDIRGMVKNPDFWYFYVERLEHGVSGWNAAVLAYEREYLRVGRLYLPPR